MHQIVQKFGSHWYCSEIAWANIVNAILNIGTKSVTYLHVGAVEICIGSNMALLDQFEKSYYTSCSMKLVGLHIQWFLC